MPFRFSGLDPARPGTWAARASRTPPCPSATRAVPVIAFHRAGERERERHSEAELWLTSFRKNGVPDSSGDGFGALDLFVEARIDPRGTVSRRPPHAAEVITYVREGALAVHAARGRQVLYAGAFQRTSVQAGADYGEKNASRHHTTHAFQLWLRGCASTSTREHTRFSAAERRGRFCAVATHDARGGSLRLVQDVGIYSALLAPGLHLVHGLGSGFNAWLHLIAGAATVEAVTLMTGDSAGFTAERVVALTALEETEVLLLELAPGEPLVRPGLVSHSN